jgi:Bacterial capsule synthesis protein PGA_cap
MLGRAVEKFANGDYDQPFSGMLSLGSYDAHIGVFECPVTTNSVSYQVEVNGLIFNCSPGWLTALKKNFPILSLSSDHLNDQGSAGIASTFQFMSKVGIQTVGTFNPHSVTDSCKPIFFPVNLTYASGQKTTGLLPIAVCSYNYKIIFSPAPGELEAIRNWAKKMPVIAMMNGGPEYEHTASSSQVNVAHKMIDYGADFVVGNGTHWVQNTEVYKGKLIVYSMGNFIFDQVDYDGRIALNLSVGISSPYNKNVAGWLSVAQKCRSQVSNCLSDAQAEGLSKMNLRYTFDVVGSYGGYLQVATKANAQQQKDIDQRANWALTQSQLLAGN